MESKTYSGKPCKHGHDGTRYKSNNICVQCHKRYHYVVKNWTQQNKEHKSQVGKIWYENNKERKRNAQRIWNLNNKDKIRTHYQNRKSRVGGQKISSSDVRKILVLQKGCCAVCKTVLDSYEIDHVVPLALGGKHEFSNLQMLCQHCNRTKSAKDPIAFMQSKGYLL